MGKFVVKQTPKPMPTADRVAAFDLISADGTPAKRFLVAGSRGTTTRENQNPSFEVHGEYRFTTGSLDRLTNKRVVVFVPGYNNTTDDTLDAARNFFKILHLSLGRDGANTDDYEYLLFTWPGDTGPIHFNSAQEYAQFSGVALYRLIREAFENPPISFAIASHSLGAHVVLRGLSILGQQVFSGRTARLVNRVLLLGAAVEDDVFERAERSEEYHFPESAFGMEYLHISASRSDEVLGGPFRVNETDKALGFNGPESMTQLSSLAGRVSEVSGGTRSFRFQLHDLSPNSATIMNPTLHVHSHGGYWLKQSQTDYYVNLLRNDQPR